MSVSVPQIQYFVLALTRIMAIFSSVPFLGGQVIPGQVRIAISVLFAILLLPWQPLPADTEAIALLPFVFSLGQELIIGLVLGFVVILTLGALQMTGEMIGFSSGFNSGRVMNPAFGDAGSALDQFFLMISLLLLMVTNGHHLIFIAIQRTFTLVPINTGFTGIPLEQILRMVAELMQDGFLLSFPVVGALLIADIALGFMAKVAPRVQVFFLGVPLKVAIGLIGLAISLSFIEPSISKMLNDIAPRMLRLLGA